MATSYKKVKTELIAIYRLEFYKNKKNWKLCQDVRRDPPPPSPEPTSRPLNETYSVELDIDPETDTEQISPHNKAFLLEEPDDTCHGLGSADDTPKIQAPPDPAPVEQQYQQTWAEQQQWMEDKSEAVWQDAEQEWCGAEAEGVPEQIAYPDECDGPCHQHQPIWPPVNQYEQLKPQYEPSDQQLEYLSPAELFQTAEEWLQSNGYSALQEKYAPYYEQHAVDDSKNFVRGAHRAPHSSETDLSGAGDECGCMCSGPLYVLTCRQLSEATQRHAAALRQLLIEQAIRDKLFPQPPLCPPLPVEEFPTRDTDPAAAECVLAAGGLAAGGQAAGGPATGGLAAHPLAGAEGSVLPADAWQSQLTVWEKGGLPAAGGQDVLPAEGRGRGRLPRIGIGMGRPYRL